MSIARERRYGSGAEVIGDGVHFRVWAPRRQRVAVLLTSDGERRPLDPEGNGYFSLHWKGLPSGTRYVYQLDDDATRYPDPASRYQPEGVHGPSEIVDPHTYHWRDRTWRGVELAGQVIYEMHVGCFTREGTWRAAEAKLPHLVETGVTLIEMMPVSDFFGDYGWGYDGVNWYAPTRLYGTPDDLRHFVDSAHGQGIGVLLDVVYNHFGPSGNYSAAFSSDFVSKRHSTEWGDAINFDAEGADGVRQFVTDNAAYWIDEFHFDGLRLDATQSIYDDSPRHVLADLSTAARAAAGDRSIILLAENESQDVRHVEPVAEGGFGLDGLWNDDFHHSCRVAATGHAEFYYADYAGTPQELLAATRWGYLYQGQYTPNSKRWRGTPAWHLPMWRFVNFLQNHDQVANSAHGRRLHALTSPGLYRALTTLWLLGPATPMLFMGQEFAASAPFLYFADHEVDLAQLVRQGRWEFLRRFPRIAGRDGVAAPLPDPSARSTFEASKLDWDELAAHTPDWQLHRELLKLRRDDPVFSRQDHSSLQGAIIGADSLLLRWFDPGSNDRLIITNLGRDMSWSPAAEPLIAAPPKMRWDLLFSSEDEAFGGSGTAVFNSREWYLPGQATMVLAPVAIGEA